MVAPMIMDFLLKKVCLYMSYLSWDVAAYVEPIASGGGFGLSRNLGDDIHDIFTSLLFTQEIKLDLRHQIRWAHCFYSE